MNWKYGGQMAGRKRGIEDLEGFDRFGEDEEIEEQALEVDDDVFFPPPPPTTLVPVVPLPTACLKNIGNRYISLDLSKKASIWSLFSLLYWTETTGKRCKTLFELEQVQKQVIHEVPRFDW